MPTPALTRPNLALGAGFLFLAPLGSTLPTNTVAGSIFTDTWPVAWVLKGATDKGTMFNEEVKASPVDAAEWANPLQYEFDGSVCSIDGALLDITASNLKAMRNGGTITVTGTLATTLNAYVPPVPGAEIRQMVGWESKDNTERLVLLQGFQVGKIAITRNKGGANKASLPFSFQGEIPATGLVPYNYWTAGVARG